MEATSLTRSLSLAPRPRRSPSATRMPALSAASPRLLPLRRARSDADLLLGSVLPATATRSSASAAVLRSPRQRILEEADAAQDTAMMEEDSFDGAGRGNNGISGGRGGGGGGGEGGAGMGEHYRRVLRLEPHNPLLLRNYGKYLHEVERDLGGAEEYYARALLVSPGDADLLSLYGRVLWEASQDKDRAAGYFERAVQAAPDDCYVLGSYASFLWDAEEDDEEEEAAAVKEKASTAVASGSPALVPAC